MKSCLKKKTESGWISTSTLWLFWFVPKWRIQYEKGVLWRWLLTRHLCLELHLYPPKKPNRNENWTYITIVCRFIFCWWIYNQLLSSSIYCKITEYYSSNNYTAKWSVIGHRHLRSSRKQNLWCLKSQLYSFKPLKWQRQRTNVLFVYDFF